MVNVYYVQGYAYDEQTNTTLYFLHYAWMTGKNVVQDAMMQIKKPKSEAAIKTFLRSSNDFLKGKHLELKNVNHSNTANAPYVSPAIYALFQL